MVGTRILVQKLTGCKAGRFREDKTFFTLAKADTLRTVLAGRSILWRCPLHRFGWRRGVMVSGVRQ